MYEYVNNIRGRQGAGDRGLGVYRDERPPWLAAPLPLLRLLSPPSVRLSPVFSLLFLVFLVSRLLHPLSPVCCLRRLSPVPCCGSKKGSRRQSDLHAAPSHHTSLAQPRGMHNLRACRNSRHAEPRGVQNLDACRRSDWHAVPCRRTII